MGCARFCLIGFMLLASGFCLLEIWFLADMGYNTPNSPLVGLALLAASLAFFVAAIWLAFRFQPPPEED